VCNPVFSLCVHMKATELPTTGHSVSCFLELSSWFGVELSSKYMKDNVAKYEMHVSNTECYDKVRERSA